MQQRLGEFNIHNPLPNNGTTPMKNPKKMKILGNEELKTTYSHSRLSTFEQCKLKFKFSYIDKVETEIEDTIEGFMGSLVHKVLEKIYKDLRYQKLNDLQGLIDLFRKEWDKNYNENIIVVKKDYSPDNYRQMGEKYISDYYKRFAPFGQDKTIATEQHIMITLGDRHRVQGYIDRLAFEGDGVYAIHDYKTSGTLMTQEYADKDRQLALYSIAVREQYKDCRKVKLIWHFLAFDKEVVSERSEEQLETLKEEIAGIIAEIERTSEFPPKTGPLCDWCEFRPLCPNFRHLYKVEDLSPNEYLDEPGVKLVNAYAALQEKITSAESELEKVKEALMEYSRREGCDVVHGSDIIATIKSYPKLSFPKKEDPRIREFHETIRKLGLWDALSTIDVYELAKRINSGDIHPELVAILERFMERGRNDRIYLRKKNRFT